MSKAILSIFLLLLLIPLSQGFSQSIDTASTLSVSLSNETPFVYRDSEGYTVVVGMVENNNSLTPVANVRIQVSFFDDVNSYPLEVIEGNTTLEFVPSNGQSTYAIRSQTPNPNITQASVLLLGFDSSEEKQKRLMVYSSEIFSDTSSFRFSGVLQNEAGAPNSNTNVYLAFYDGFEPPRILEVHTIELGNVGPNSKVIFEIDEKINANSKGFLLFAESNIFYSDVVDIKIPSTQLLTKLVTISGVTVKDTMGNNLSEIKLGSTVNIESETWIQFAADQKSNETAYTYYVQIKKFGEHPFVEFIGKYDGRFIGVGFDSQIIDWVPEEKGLFFIETFVWDRNNIPISKQGPFVLINVI